MRHPEILLASFALALLLLPADASGTTPNVSFSDCNLSERTQVRNALQWLIDNPAKLDQKMGSKGLMDWPGDSRSKFRNKVKSKIEVACISSKTRCTQAKSNGYVLGGRTVPVLHQRRVALCTNNLPDEARYVSVIAHEIGHLIRINAHRTNCERRCEDPRFSQSLGLAAYHARTSTNYSVAACKSTC